MTNRERRRAKGAESYRYGEATRCVRLAAAMPSRPTHAGDYWTVSGWAYRWAEAFAAVLAWGLG